MTTIWNTIETGNIAIDFETCSEDISISYEAGQYFDESGKTSITTEFNDFQIENRILAVYIKEGGLWNDIEEANTPVFRAMVKEYFTKNMNTIINELIEEYKNN